MLMVLIGWSSFLYQQDTHGALINYLYNLGYAIPYVLGAAVSVYAARMLGGGLAGKGFLYLALSLASYAIGQVVWTYYNLFASNDVPYPSLADVFFILFIPFTALSIFAFLRIYRVLLSRRIVVESVLVFIAATAAIFLYQGSDYFFGDITLLEKAFNIMYLLTDSLLITFAAIVIRTSGGTFHKGLIILVAGYLIRASADLVFYYRAAQQLYWNGDVSDLLYAVSAVVIAMGAIHLARDLTATYGQPVEQASPEPAQASA